MSIDINGIADVNEMLNSLSLMSKVSVNYRKIAGKAKEIISNRTLSGLGADYNEFSPYSRSYLEYKEERKGGDVRVVDLFDEGNMLGGMSVTSTKLSSRLFFLSPTENDKALKHNEGLDGLPKREFFALNEIEVDDVLIPLVDSDINKYMGKL